MNSVANDNGKATESDEVHEVPTEVLRSWVTDGAQCLWENTIGKAPAWTGDAVQNRATAAPGVRPLPRPGRVPGAGELGCRARRRLSGALRPAEWDVLREMWPQRLRADVESLRTEGGDPA